MIGIQQVCPECQAVKPEDPANLHDMVLDRLDWRKAERERIEDPIPKSTMCNACFLRIQDEWAPKAPRFDKRGNRDRQVDLALVSAHKEDE